MFPLRILAPYRARGVAMSAPVLSDLFFGGWRTAVPAGALAKREFHAVSSFKGRHLTSILDLSKDELQAMLNLSADLKKAYKKPTPPQGMPPLQGKSVAMIFQKRSTRTRVSTETGMAMLGGHALFLGPQDIQLNVNESLQDTALVLSRFNSIILARVFSHDDILGFTKHATVPVINALSDLHHPLQALADLLTLQEHFGSLKDKTIAWVGDGNNVFHDLAIAAVKMDMNVRISCPKGYEPNPEIMKAIQELAEKNGRTVTLTRDPKVCVKDADVVVTDTWVSMGQEDEYEKRVKEFDGYQVNKALMSLASPSAVFLHCLPRHKEEVADEVFYSTQSLVFPEAENRMWTVMAVMLSQLGK